MLVCGGERLWWWLHWLHVTQQYRLASMAAWLSSTGISHHNLLPHIPLIHLSAVNNSPHPGIAPQSWNSSPCHCAAQDMYGCGRDSLILIPFRLPQISCFPLHLKCFSSDSDNCPDAGLWPLLQFPHPPRAGPVLLTLLLFPPSSLILPSFACIYIFFTSGQVLLFALSWCSACASVSEGVLLMYPWREVLHVHLLLCHLVLSPLSSDNHFSIFLTIWLGDLSINSDSSFSLASHQSVTMLFYSVIYREAVYQIG